MRTIIYAIYNEETEKKTVIGCSLRKTEETMAEMIKENPSAKLKIVHKWRSF